MGMMPPASPNGDQTTQSQDPRMRLFAYLDTNHDGYISPQEFANAQMPMNRGRGS
jgi:hypothetical protein